jgi:ankyrin repeat protein
VDVNAPQDDGATALHWAAHWDDLAMADLLIQAGANASAADDLGVTPLFMACTNGSGTMVERLLAAGANANAASVTGETPLMTCSRGGNANAVKALLAHGSNVNAKENSRDQTALMWAVAQRHPEAVRVLLEHGADVHARSRVSGDLVVRDVEGARFVCPPDAGEETRRKSSYKVQAIAGSSDIPKVSCAVADMAPKGGSTPLLFAARTGGVESTRLLVAARANVNDAAPDGNSALVEAAYSRHGDVAALLLDKDANPNAAGAGYTAMHIAVLTGDLDLLKALLAHGANPNVQLAKGTPVLRDNVDLHLRDELIGATPFFLAAKFVEVEMMRTLAASGADTRLGLRDGTSPLMAAAGVGWRVASYTRRDTHTPAAGPPPPDDDEALAAVKLALDLGGEVNASNDAGETPLHGAAAAGYAPIIQLLVEHGAKLDAKNRRGLTALATVKIDPEGTKGRHETRTADLMLRKLGAKDE